MTAEREERERERDRQTDRQTERDGTITTTRNHKLEITMIHKYNLIF